MRRRSIVPLFVVIAVVGTVPLPAAGQAPTDAADGAVALRTAWGAPDLHGVWWGSTITPLERPEEVTNEFLTDEQEAELVQQSSQRNLDWDAGTDLARAYDLHWFDRPSSVASNRRTSLIVDPPNGRIPALSPEVQQWMASPEGRQVAANRAALSAGTLIVAGPEDTSLWDQCISRGLTIRSGGYNNYYRIFQTADHVAILSEMIHEARIIPLDDSPHLPVHVRQWLGDGRGHWEGDTLVVETTNISPKQILPFRPRASAEGLRLVERFTRADADTLDYELTIDDPTTYSRPWTVVLPLTTSTGELYEYACHEGNKGLYGILAGSRAVEKRAAQEAVKTESK